MYISSQLYSIDGVDKSGFSSECDDISGLIVCTVRVQVLVCIILLALEINL